MAQSLVIGLLLTVHVRMELLTILWHRFFLLGENNSIYRAL